MTPEEIANDLRDKGLLGAADLIERQAKALWTISEFAAPADSSRRNDHTELWKMTVNAMKEIAREALGKE